MRNFNPFNRVRKIAVTGSVRGSATENSETSSATSNQNPLLKLFGRIRKFFIPDRGVAISPNNLQTLNRSDELIKAAQEGDLEKIKDFVSQGIDLDVTDKFGTPLLIHAVKKADKVETPKNEKIDTDEIVFDIDIFSDREDQIAATKLSEKHLEVIKYLLSQGLSVTQMDHLGNTALHYAALAGNIDEIKRLTENGADVNKANAERITPLMYSIDNGHNAAANFLITSGANINAQDKFGFTVLMHAVKKNNTKIIQDLISREVDLDAVHQDRTALDISAKRDFKNITAEIIIAIATSKNNEGSAWQDLQSQLPDLAADNKLNYKVASFLAAVLPDEIRDQVVQGFNDNNIDQKLDLTSAGEIEKLRAKKKSFIENKLSLPNQKRSILDIEANNLIANSAANLEIRQDDMLEVLVTMAGMMTSPKESSSEKSPLNRLKNQDSRTHYSTFGRMIAPKSAPEFFSSSLSSAPIKNQPKSSPELSRLESRDAVVKQQTSATLKKPTTSSIDFS